MRRRPDSEIKLLRVELQPKGISPIEGLGFEWSPAQPTDTLSPKKAAEVLGVEEWACSSIVKKRFRALQLRYPPEQFSENHLQWRPAAELLSTPLNRLNWYWQSGCIPWPTTHKTALENSLWNVESVFEPPTPASYFSAVSAGISPPWSIL